MLFSLVAVLLAAGAPAQPTVDFWERFSSPPPGVSIRSPWFVEFGARIALTDPSPRKPLDRYAVLTGVCVYDAPCTFRLSVLLLLEDVKGIAVPIGVRYLLDTPNGARAEGFASAAEPGGVFTFHRYRAGTWSVLAEGTEAVNEEMFVQATVKYVAAQ
jgi:hypothetical protein